MMKPGKGQMEMSVNGNNLAQPLAVSPEETFDDTWLFEARYTEAPGFRMHYADEGEGETVLVLHGEPTWGYLFKFDTTLIS